MIFFYFYFWTRTVPTGCFDSVWTMQIIQWSTNGVSQSCIDMTERLNNHYLTTDCHVTYPPHHQSTSYVMPPPPKQHATSSRQITTSQYCTSLNGLPCHHLLIALCHVHSQSLIATSSQTSFLTSRFRSLDLLMQGSESLHSKQHGRNHQLNMYHDSSPYQINASINSGLLDF